MKSEIYKCSRTLLKHNGLKEMWKRFSEIEVSSWSRLLNYITTTSCHNDESAVVVVADDASSSSLLLLLSAAGHDASVWAPIECPTTVRNWIRLYAPLKYLVMHALMRLSFSVFHFFFGRRISPRFPSLLLGATLSTPAFSAPPNRRAWYCLVYRRVYRLCCVRVHCVCLLRCHLNARSRAPFRAIRWLVRTLAGRCYMLL